MLNFSTIPPVDVQEPRSLVPYPADPDQPVWNYTQGTRVARPDVEGSGRLLRAAGLLVHEGRLHGRVRQAARVGPPLHDRLLGSAERARPGAQLDAGGLHPPLRRGCRSDAPRAADHQVRGHLAGVSRGAAATSSSTSSTPRTTRPASRSTSSRITSTPCPRPTRRPDVQQYTFFTQADGFLNVVRYVEAIRQAAVARHPDDDQRDRLDLRGRPRAGCARLRVQADPGLVLVPVRCRLRVPLR